MIKTIFIDSNKGSKTLCVNKLQIFLDNEPCRMIFQGKTKKKTTNNC
jgi:hypothetical protein